MYKFDRELIPVQIVVALWLALAAACACAGLSAPDPATAAREARKASVRACDAYDAAVRLRTSLRDEATEKVCASVRAVCDESPAE